MPVKKKTPKKSTAKKAPSKSKSTSKAVPKKKTIESISGKGSKPKRLGSTINEEKGFPIVGIGASAGGLNAFEKFLKNMPVDSGMAFVLVPHLDPKHISILPELLQKHTKMPVSLVKDGMMVQHNSVYVIPPNKFLAILHGSLHLMPPKVITGSKLPVDSFFRSLAQDQRKNAIGIILSGTGTDGTLGIKEIRGEGGMVMVQDPKSAAYDGMPRSAQATGLVDYTLPPEKMPKQLINYTAHFSMRKDTKAVPTDGKIPETMQKIFVLLRSQTGHDFSAYKQNTLCRRIERRINVHQIDTIENYVHYLDQNPQEVKILFKELLIGVTNFFRDPESFETIKKKTLPVLLKGKPKDYCLRAWVPGCSTGEEAYSLAIILKEHMNEHKQYFKVQIFATDIDDESIEKARAGIYPSSITADVSQNRLKQFFTHEDTVYRVSKEIREMVVCAVQNLILDPPFTKMDLVCCRNLLIYLSPELQRKVVPIFHYSLNPKGGLCLSSSESIGGFLDLFTVVDKKWKLFQSRKTKVASRQLLQFPFVPKRFEADATDTNQIGGNEELTTSQMVEKVLLENFAPSCAVINENNEVIYIHGRTGKYLEPASGEPNFNLLEMARQGLKMKLATAIRKAHTQKQEIKYEGLQVKDNGALQFINLTVSPISKLGTMQGLLIVVFEDVSPPVKISPTTIKRGSGIKDGKRVKELEQELQDTKENLQTSIEEMETTNEELKSTNEELQSTNEELQSTNEEIETSKEELQSLNEELVTVNAELEGRVDELAKNNDDIRNLLDSTNIATIFLDTDLCVTRFTPKATEIINLIQTDIGRPLSHIVSNLKYEKLSEDAKKVLDTLVVVEQELLSTEECWYFMRIAPYRTVDNIINGVVITFEEITMIKEVQQKASDAQNYAENIIETLREPLLVLDSEMRIVSSSHSFYDFFKVTSRDITGTILFELGNRQWDIPELKKLLLEILPKKKIIYDFAVTHDFPKVGLKKLLLNAREIRQKAAKRRLILLTIEDVMQ